MRTYDGIISSLMKELDESWDYDPYANEAGQTIYIGFATKMAYMTACGILNKNLEPNKWTVDDQEDGRIAMHVRTLSAPGGAMRVPPVNRLRHLMSSIGYEEGSDWWIETT